MKVNVYPEPLGYDLHDRSKVTQSIVKFNTMVWRKKKSLNVSLKSHIKDIEIPDLLQEYSDGLSKMHNLV